jgi:hypothetical protein
MVARNTLTFYRDWRNHPMPYKRDLRRFVSKHGDRRDIPIQD